MWFVAIIGALIFGYAILMLWYAWGWQKLPKVNTLKHQLENLPAVSIIIPARNETATIAACVQGLLQQNYPNNLLQIIVVNDNSTDNTVQVIEAIAKLNTNVLIVSSVETGKKAALAAGIAVATNPLLLITDADCTHPLGWVHAMVSPYVAQNRAFTAGPVMYNHTGGILSMFQLLDFMMMQGITAASVSLNFANMCNGANLAYTKTAFNSVKGFKGIDAVPTGDDMLLMHKIATQIPHSTTWLKNAAAIVNTDPMPTWRSFLQQRIRWGSKATVFTDKRLYLVLLLVYLLNAGLVILAFTALFMPHLWWFWLTAIIFKTFFEWPLMYSVALFFNQKHRLIWFMLLQPVHIFYITVAGWLGQFGSYNWKGRVISKT